MWEIKEIYEGPLKEMYWYYISNMPTNIFNNYNYLYNFKELLSIPMNENCLENYNLRITNPHRDILYKGFKLIQNENILTFCVREDHIKTILDYLNKDYNSLSSILP